MLTNLLNIIFPVYCPYCDKLGCSNCEKKIKNRNLIRIFENKNFKLICLSPFIYEGKVKKAILKYKFFDRKDFAKIFAKSMAKSLKEKFSLLNFDFITNVPLDKKKLSERGYDQAFELAKEISKLTKIPYKKILAKKTTNISQHNLNSIGRKRNSKGVYYILDSVILNDKKILICDDVITTGSTLSSCALILKNLKINKVYAITLACTI